MERTEKLSTSVTEDEKSRFRVLAAERDMTMAELLRELVYEELQEEEHQKAVRTEGNPSPGATTTD
ncbi:ribbon-helix-helix protein [Halosimplex amylolyticum]|uniref:ribbon-helix-helix protein n=1 Tax=Halosimplex amylolyticum TaxID=3396616 RepID=UPI003F562F9D